MIGDLSVILKILEGHPTRCENREVFSIVMCKQIYLCDASFAFRLGVFLPLVSIAKVINMNTNFFTQ